MPRGRYRSAVACEDCGGHEFFPCGTCIACHQNRSAEEKAENEAHRARTIKARIEKRSHHAYPEPYEYRRPERRPEPRIDPFAGGAFAETNRSLATARR